MAAINTPRDYVDARGYTTRDKENAFSRARMVNLSRTKADSLESELFSSMEGRSISRALVAHRYEGKGASKSEKQAFERLVSILASSFADRIGVDPRVISKIQEEHPVLAEIDVHNYLIGNTRNLDINRLCKDMSRTVVLTMDPVSRRNLLNSLDTKYRRQQAKQETAARRLSSSSFTPSNTLPEYNPWGEISNSLPSATQMKTAYSGWKGAGKEKHQQKKWQKDNAVKSIYKAGSPILTMAANDMVDEDPLGLKEMTTDEIMVIGSDYGISFDTDIFYDKADVIMRVYARIVLVNNQKKRHLKKIDNVTQRNQRRAVSLRKKIDRLNNSDMSYDKVLKKKNKLVNKNKYAAVRDAMGRRINTNDGSGMILGSGGTAAIAIKGNRVRLDAIDRAVPVLVMNDYLQTYKQDNRSMQKDIEDMGESTLYGTERVRWWKRKRTSGWESSYYHRTIMSLKRSDYNALKETILYIGIPISPARLNLDNFEDIVRMVDNYARNVYNSLIHGKGTSKRQAETILNNLMELKNSRSFQSDVTSGAFSGGTRAWATQTANKDEFFTGGSASVAEQAPTKLSGLLGSGTGHTEVGGFVDGPDRKSPRSFRRTLTKEASKKARMKRVTTNMKAQHKENYENMVLRGIANEPLSVDNEDLPPNSKPLEAAIKKLYAANNAIVSINDFKKAYEQLKLFIDKINKQFEREKRKHQPSKSSYVAPFTLSGYINRNKFAKYTTSTIRKALLAILQCGDNSVLNVHVNEFADILANEIFSSSGLVHVRGSGYGALIRLLSSNDSSSMSTIINSATEAINAGKFDVVMARLTKLEPKLYNKASKTVDKIANKTDKWAEVSAKKQLRASQKKANATNKAIRKEKKAERANEKLEKQEMKTFGRILTDEERKKNKRSQVRGSMVGGLIGGTVGLGLGTEVGTALGGSAASSALASGAGSLIGGLASTVGKANPIAGAVVGAVGTAAGAITSLATSLSDSAKAEISSAANATKESFKSGDFFGGIKNSFKTAGSALKNTFGNAETWKNAAPKLASLGTGLIGGLTGGLLGGSKKSASSEQANKVIAQQQETANAQVEAAVEQQSQLFRKASNSMVESTAAIPVAIVSPSTIPVAVVNQIPPFTAAATEASSSSGILGSLSGGTKAGIIGGAIASGVSALGSIGTTVASSVTASRISKVSSASEACFILLQEAALAERLNSMETNITEITKILGAFVEKSSGSDKYQMKTVKVSISEADKKEDLVVGSKMDDMTRAMSVALAGLGSNVIINTSQTGNVGGIPTGTDTFDEQ